MPKRKDVCGNVSPEKRRYLRLVINVMDNGTHSVIETHAARCWDAAKRAGRKMVMRKGNEGAYIRIYDDNDHSNVIFITRERVKKQQKKVVGEIYDD